MLKILKFGSRTFAGVKKKYHSSKLEFLALKRAMCEVVQDYLFYVPHFNLYTIRVIWFRLLPSWHIQWWLPVFLSVNRPFLKIFPSRFNNKKIRKTCSRQVIKWLYAESWCTREGSSQRGKKLRMTVFAIVKVSRYETTQNHLSPPIDQ